MFGFPSVELTPGEYVALADPDPGVVYVIRDMQRGEDGRLHPV